MRYPNIQLLRVVAAVVVLVYHAGALGRVWLDLSPGAERRFGAWGGWLFAVPLFFAVSGFVLAHAARSATPGRFLLARFLRLYPGYWLAVAVVAGPTMFGLLGPQYALRPRDLHADNLLLWPGGSGPGGSLLQHAEWSLVYEVVFSTVLGGLLLLGRRGAAVGVGVWLLAVGVKAVVAPGLGTVQFAHWSTVLLSGHNTAFLLGAVAHALSGRGRRWRWAVLAALGLWLWFPYRLSWRSGNLDCLFAAVAVAVAAVVWLAVQFRQVRADHPLVRAGDWTYGLYLVHTPVLLLVYNQLRVHGGPHRVPGVLIGIAVALAVGLLFGRAESRLHGLLRPLAKARVRVPAWPARLSPRAVPSLRRRHQRF